ncbi:lysylphosphatidylglycerol synthase domain-containing protein [Lichenicola sp.]|uniref:lysylphosphatidylglycerol synthase domain-containing protein n=1 Tax=Lichenicola sp. TaxID=2804529 RepID=UPI003B00FDE1
MLRRLPPLLGLLLFGGAIYAVQKEVRHLSVGQIRDSLLGIPRISLLASAGFTLLSYFVLSFYDRLATIHVGCRLSFGRTAFAAFCSYVLSHNLGFAAISGAAVRFRLYGNWGVRPAQITQIIAFCSLTYILGASALIGGVLLLEPSSLPMLLDRVPHWLLTTVGVAAWGLVALYVGLSARLQSVTLWRWTIPLPGMRMSIGQVAVAALDVACTAAIAYTLLPAGIGLDYPAFLAIYIASYSAGLIAGVPGGLGVFDGAMVLGLSPYLPASEALGVILVFRLFYYILPLFIAGLLFAGHEVLLRGDMLLARRHGLSQPARVRASTLIRESEADFAVIVAAGAVSLCGAMLLALGGIGTTPDLAFVLPPPVGLFSGESTLSWFLEAAGDYIPSLIGAVLMGLAIGLSQRVTLAWGTTLILLCIAAALTALRGLPLAVPAMLILAALVIAPFRSSYYRHARLLSEPLAPATVLPLLLLMGCVLILVQLEPAIRSLADNSWLELVAGKGMSSRTRLSVGLSVLVGLLAIARLILPGRISPTPWSAEAAARYRALAPDSALPLAPPDGLVSGETGRALIPFRRLGRIMAGLGDPAGAPADQISTIWRLRDLALQEGREPVFWRVGSSLLDVYADLGLQAWPIGATAGSRSRSDSADGDCCYLCCPAERGELLLALLGREFERTIT